ncbi:MAG: methylated-DNA--[protein]-cysteine S-methyltransferase [Pseudomonadota bacterium]
MKIQQGGPGLTAIVPAPFGAMGIRSDGVALRQLLYLPAHYAEGAATPADAISALAARQLLAYFDDPDQRFDLPLASVGSAFQQRVWQAVAAIPRGQVRTYGQVARQIGSAARAVGQACGANWFPLLVPCHRVTAAAGLGGFANDDNAAGFHLGVKRWLLAHEDVAGYT